MEKSKQAMVRNVLQTASETRARNKSAENEKREQLSCTLSQMTDLSSSKPHTTSKILRQIENLQLEDLDFDSDDDVPVGPLSFSTSDRLYSNLVSLDSNFPIATKVHQSKIVRSPVAKDAAPDPREFLIHPPPSTYSFRQMMVPEFPQVITVHDDHSLHKKQRRWKNI